MGVDRIQLVDDLLARLDDIQAGRSVPHVVILEAESGAGKSRIVREFYDRLRAERDRTGYWPALVESANERGAGVDPMPARKIIGPPLDGFVWKANALPEFLWWGLSCGQLRSGQSMDVVRPFEDLLNRHAVPMWCAWNQEAGKLEKALQYRDDALASVREAVQEGAVNVAAGILEAAGLPVPFLGWAIGQASRGWKLARERQAYWEEARIEVIFESPATEVAAAVCTQASRFLRRNLPAVVVIEDAHLMDESLAALSTALASLPPDRPVLVIATAWSEGHGEGVYGKWRDEAVRASQAEVRHLNALSDSDLDAILRSYAGRTTSDTAARVVDRWTNPLALELFLTWDPIARNIRENDGALVLSEGQIAAFPRYIADLYRARWDTLPTDVQRGLKMAVAGIPSDRGLDPFLRSVIAETCVEPAVQRAWGRVAENDLVGSLERAEEKKWLHPVDLVALRFGEELLAQIASSELSEVDTELDMASSIRAAATKLLSTWIHEARGDGYELDLDDPSVPIVITWLLALVDDGGPFTGEIAVAVAVAQITEARRLADGWQFEEAISRLESPDAFEVLPAEHLDVLDARLAFGMYLGEAGHTSYAITQLVLALEEVSRLGFSANTDLWPYEQALAVYLGEMGYEDDEYALWLSLVSKYTAGPGPDDRQTLKCRASLAYCMAERGQIDAALDAYRALLRDQRRVLGDEHEDSLWTESMYAGWLGRSGQLDAAILQYDSVITRQQASLGRDHPDSLTSRHNRAYLLADAGRFAEALVEYESVMRLRESILSKDSTSTMASHYGLAFTLGEAGKVSEAIAEFESLLVDNLRVLGPNHPDTITTRNSLAIWLDEAGRVDEAEEQREVVRQVERDSVQPDEASE